MPEDIHNLTVIGAGPVGLFGAYYAGLRGMRVKLIDSLPQPGGQLAALYPDKQIYDVPGFPSVLAADLVQGLASQAAQFNPEICLEEKAESLRTLEDGILEITTQKQIHLSRSVIIACGAGAFMPRTLDLQSVQRLEGRGVHYFVKSRDLFRHRRVLVVGGGDSALDWALELSGLAAEVTLIHKRERWSAHEATVRSVMQSPVHVHTPCEVLEVHGEDHVNAVTVINNQTGKTATWGIDELLLSLGFLTNLGPVKQWGLQLQGNGILVDSQMRTNLPGVYAAGDIAAYPGKLKLIATGTAEAAIAANSIKSMLDPGAKYYPGHSTDRQGMERRTTEVPIAKEPGQ